MCAARHLFRTTVFVGALALAPVGSLIGQGIAPCVHEAPFGLVNLARLQTIQLNVVNLATPPDPIAPEPCGAVVPALEIFEPFSGRTQVFSHPLEIFGFNPQPEPPG